MLENQAMRIKRGEKPFWPVWLAPIQVRLVPVSPAQTEGAFDRELSGGDLTVRSRADGQMDMSLDAFLEKLSEPPR